MFVIKGKLKTKIRLPKKKKYETYLLESKEIIEKERPPIITIERYRKKFNIKCLKKEK